MEVRGSVVALFSLVLALAALQQGALAWGPLSHGTFNCLGVHAELSVAQCLETQTWFAVGSDMPDAFGFGNFNITEGTPNLCQGLTYVHDPYFAGEQILFAQNYSAPADFDPLSFSLAFAGHIVGDLVGFNAAGGILCSSQAASCTAQGILYMPEWGYMSALDAFFYANYSMNASALPTSGALPASAFQFVSDATVHYNSLNPSFASVSPAAVAQCASYWSGNMEYVYQRAAFYASSDVGTQFLRDELAFFAPAPPSSQQQQQQQQQQRPRGRRAGDWPTVLAYLEAQTLCASSAVQAYMSYLLGEKVGSKQAFASTAAYVASLYKDGVCTPPPAL